jgi:hypothetical protein
LFCLANADLLDYDVSQQAVRSLNWLTQGYASKHTYSVVYRLLNKIQCFHAMILSQDSGINHRIYLYAEIHRLTDKTIVFSELEAFKVVVMVTR